MSSRIEEIVEVIQEVRKNFHDSFGHVPITKIRIEATRSVAARRGIAYPTVKDKFIRQLRPEIRSAEQFDSYLSDWLLNNSDELRKILLKHISDYIDEDLINTALYKETSEPELLVQESTTNHFIPEEVIDSTHLFEGAKQKITINAYERNSKARRICIDHYGAICLVCGFEFSKKYGAIGEDYIHVHHIKPLSEITEQYEVDPIQDLRPVCPNCHAMLHRRNPPYSIDELIAIISKTDTL